MVGTDRSDPPGFRKVVSAWDYRSILTQTTWVSQRLPKDLISQYTKASIIEKGRSTEAGFHNLLHNI